MFFVGDDGIYIGEHDYSYLTLDEIQKYNWAKVIEKEGYNPGEIFERLLIPCRNLKNWRVVFGFDN